MGAQQWRRMYVALFLGMVGCMATPQRIVAEETQMPSSVSIPPEPEPEQAGALPQSDCDPSTVALNDDPQSVHLDANQLDALGVVLHDGRPRCSATLISEKFVLTAAHCVADIVDSEGTVKVLNPQGMTFAVGTDANKPKASFEVIRIEVHADLHAVQGDFRYTVSSLGLAPDLGILELRESVRSKLPKIRPIPVNFRPLEGQVGSAVLQAGFGVRGTQQKMRYRHPPESAPLEDVLPRYFRGGARLSPLAPGDSGSGFVMKFSDGAVRVISIDNGALFGQKPDFHYEGDFGPRTDAFAEWIVGIIGPSCLQDMPLPTKLSDSTLTCGGLSDCAAQCNFDMWCQLACAEKTSIDAQSQWSQIGDCQICAIFGQLCNTAAGVEAAACAADCQDHLAPACIKCTEKTCASAIAACAG